MTLAVIPVHTLIPRLVRLMVKSPITNDAGGDTSDGPRVVGFEVGVCVGKVGLLSNGSVVEQVLDLCTTDL